MAFQGVQQPDMIGLALNLMQMRRDNELAQRKMALEEARLQFEQQQAAAETVMKLRENAGKEASAGAALGPSLSVATDSSAPAEDQAAAARAYLPALMQEAQFRAAGGPVTADILNQIGNEAASAGALSRTEARAKGPTTAWDYDESGKYRRRSVVKPDGSLAPVPGAKWVPVSAGVTVNNINGAGQLDLGKIADVSRAEQAAFQERIAPFEALDNAKATLDSFKSMADENGLLPYEASQFVSSDVMAAMRKEALNEGDVRRLTSVGLMNTAKEWLGIPPQMTVKQADTLARIVAEKARAKEPKRKAIIADGVFRAKQFGFDPRLIVGDYADQSKPKPKPADPAPAGTPDGALPRARDPKTGKLMERRGPDDWVEVSE